MADEELLLEERFAKKVSEIRQKNMTIEDKNEYIDKLLSQISSLQMNLEQKDFHQKHVVDKLMEMKGRLRASEEALEGSSIQLALTIREMYQTKADLKILQEKMKIFNNKAADILSENISSNIDFETMINEIATKYSDMVQKCIHVEKSNRQLQLEISTRDDKISTLQSMICSYQPSSPEYTTKSSVSAMTTPERSGMSSMSSNNVTPIRTSKESTVTRLDHMTTNPDPDVSTSLIYNESQPSRSVFSYSLDIHSQHSLSDCGYSHTDCGSVQSELPLVKKNLTALSALSAIPSSNSLERNDSRQIMELIQQAQQFERMQASLSLQLSELRSVQFERKQIVDVQKSSISQLFQNSFITQSNAYAQFESRMNDLQKKVTKLASSFFDLLLVIKNPRYFNQSQLLQLVEKAEAALQSPRDNANNIEQDQVSQYVADAQKCRQELKERDEQLKKIMTILHAKEEQLVLFQRELHVLHLRLRSDEKSNHYNAGTGGTSTEAGAGLAYSSKAGYTPFQAAIAGPPGSHMYATLSRFGPEFQKSVSAVYETGSSDGTSYCSYVSSEKGSVSSDEHHALEPSAVQSSVLVDDAARAMVLAAAYSSVYSVACSSTGSGSGCGSGDTDDDADDTRTNPLATFDHRHFETPSVRLSSGSRGHTEPVLERHTRQYAR